MTVDRDLFFRLMSSFASGVTVITSQDAEGTPRGFTASAFCSLSLDPTLCLVSVDRGTESLPAIQASQAFVVNILADDQEAVSRRFASKSAEKFAGLAYRAGGATGVPIIEGALAWIECRVKDLIEGGDHVILVGDIQDGGAREGAPLLYFRGQYRHLA